MIALVFWLLILLLVIVITKYIVDELTLPPKVKAIVWLILGVLFLLLLLNALGLLPMFGPPVVVRGNP